MFFFKLTNRFFAYAEALMMRIEDELVRRALIDTASDRYVRMLQWRYHSDIEMLDAQKFNAITTVVRNSDFLEKTSRCTERLREHISALAQEDAVDDQELLLLRGIEALASYDAERTRRQAETLSFRSMYDYFEHESKNLLEKYGSALANIARTRIANNEYDALQVILDCPQRLQLEVADQLARSAA